MVSKYSVAKYRLPEMFLLPGCMAPISWTPGGTQYIQYIIIILCGSFLWFRPHHYLLEPFWRLDISISLETGRKEQLPSINALARLTLGHLSSCFSFEVRQCPISALRSPLSLHETKQKFSRPNYPFHYYWHGQIPIPISLDPPPCLRSSKIYSKNSFYFPENINISHITTFLCGETSDHSMILLFFGSCVIMFAVMKSFTAPFLGGLVLFIL